jgi:hypothetical protein
MHNSRNDHNTYTCDHAYRLLTGRINQDLARLQDELDRAIRLDAPPAYINAKREAVHALQLIAQAAHIYAP